MFVDNAYRRGGYLGISKYRSNSGHAGTYMHSLRCVVHACRVNISDGILAQECKRIFNGPRITKLVPKNLSAAQQSRIKSIFTESRGRDVLCVHAISASHVHARGRCQKIGLIKRNMTRQTGSNRPPTTFRFATAAGLGNMVLRTGNQSLERHQRRRNIE